MPAIFSDKNANSEETVVLKFSKSLYVIVQAHRTWYQHLHKVVKSLEFYPSGLENSMYYGPEMIIIT